VFRSLFLANPDALLLVDLQGVIRLANPAALELLGYAEEDLVGLSVDDLAPRGPTMHTSSPIGARPD